MDDKQWDIENGEPGNIHVSEADILIPYDFVKSVKFERFLNTDGTINTS